jgi:putative spermidine/putrescine transport system substrate-binding protein
VRLINARRISALAIAGALAVTVSACGSSSSDGSGSSGSAKDWKTAQSAEAGGGMDALVKAAKKEGTLNVIALPPDWANYGEIISAFKTKYGIQVNSANPNGSSGDEMNALGSTKGQASAPDVVDIGNSFAIDGAKSGAFAPYKVATWDDIPEGQKDTGGLWASDYGGYISIGCNAKAVGGTCPKTIADLNNPEYKGKVALNGDPTSANAAFEALYAAAVANGGSADDIQPGIDFFAKLNDAGIFNKTQATPATVASGATPIVLDWDYLNAANVAKLKQSNIDWTVAVPTDGLVSAFYSQAINVNAPHPAAARLWEEFLYSQDADGGQNLWLKGLARPAELVAMQKNGKAVGADKLPAVDDANPFLPTEAQAAAAKAVVTSKWAAAVK